MKNSKRRMRRSTTEHATLISEVKRSIDNSLLKVSGIKINMVKKVAQKRRDSVLCTNHKGIFSIRSGEKVSLRMRGISVLARLIHAIQQPRSDIMVQ